MKQEDHLKKYKVHGRYSTPRLAQFNPCHNNTVSQLHSTKLVIF